MQNEARARICYTSVPYWLQFVFHIHSKFLAFVSNRTILLTLCPAEEQNVLWQRLTACREL